ncbi:AvrE-family type 3 secretion system effector [Pseudomonas sp. 21LCFQ02]|uniref:AvrE-family type 3 secretion system effector n=1 Tax=Pseudomonas sp. 21LCFQ02 TaxID=2957505 RepID=UPI00209B0043|nr:AvrE-family type 3 secretion system effector [Pseudomonas sp. 21LCFQ02]MCO8169100.1 AvrE-family type 3 secretion system effector [Pseudomonas sp. 21LCFQ02]
MPPSIQNTPTAAQLHGPQTVGHNPQGLQQQANQPATQRASTSLAQLMRQSSGPLPSLTQDVQATPRQGPAASPGALLTAALDPEDAAVRAAVQATRGPGAKLRGADGFGRSLPGSERKSSASPGDAGASTSRSEASAALPANAVLDRSQAGRFVGLDGQIERIKLPPLPVSDVSLDAKGHASFEHFDPPALKDLLQNTLGQEGKTYLAHNRTEQGNKQVLLEADGHLLHLEQSDTALVVMRSSDGLALPAGSKPGSVELFGKDQSMGLKGDEGPGKTLPDKALLAQVSGVYQDRDGQQLRLHDDKLQQLHPATRSWSPVPQSAGQKFSELTHGGNGQVYGRNSDTLIELSGDKGRHMHLPGLTAHSVAADGSVAMLAGKDTQTVQIGKMGDAQPLQVTLQLDGGKAEAAHVGLSRDRLFVTDTEGRLYSASREVLKNTDGALKLQPETGYQPAGGKLGAQHQVTGFMSGADGQLHVQVKNNAGQTHSHTLDEQSASLKGGWNLSDVIVIENKRGLPVAKTPPNESIHNLERGGSIGLVDGRIQKWDTTTQDWKDTGLKDIDRLQRGTNGSAFVLKEGKLSHLKVEPDYAKNPFNSQHQLTQAPRSTKVEVGDELKGLDDRVIKAFAAVTDKQFVAMDDSGRMTAHQDKQDPKELTRQGLNGEVAHLALDADGTLHAQTSNGELYFMAKDDWQAKPQERPDAKWTRMPVPGKVETLRTEDDNSISVKLKESPLSNGQDTFNLKGKTWSPMDPRPVDPNALRELFDRLDNGTTRWKIPFTGGTATASVNLLGRNGMEQSHKSGTMDFIRAHVFKPSLEIPRPLQNMGDYAQHLWQGREGLGDVYKAQAPLFKQLSEIDTSTSAPAAGHNLKDRIASLELGSEGKTLVDELQTFREDLEKSAHGTVMHMGREKKLLNLHGEFKEGLKDKPPSAPRDNDLITLASTTLDKLAPSQDNPTGKLLQDLKGKGMTLSHMAVDTPADQRRDGGNHLQLSKARLALDIVTLKGLDELVDKAQNPPPGTDPAAHAKTLKAGLEQLRDKTYGENPIKQVTDMGFSGHRELEKTYNGIKAFLNGFNDPQHAISVNMRAATGSADQAQLAATLKDSLKRLEHPDDELAISRNYGMTVSTPFFNLAKLAPGPWPAGSVDGTRNYALMAERGEKGVEVYMFHEGAGTLNAGVGGGENFLPNITSADQLAKMTAIDTGNDRRGAFAFRFGGDVTLSDSKTQRTGVAFTVPDEKIDRFVDDLFGGKLKPMDILKEASNHKSHHMSRNNFEVNASATLEARLQLGITDKDSKPLTAAARFGAGVTVNVNLATHTKQTLSQENPKERLDEESKNRMRFFNSLKGNVFGRAQLAGSNTQAAPAPGAAPSSQAINNSMGLTATLAADSKTTKRVKFKYEEATPLSTEDVTKLSTSLEKAFKDKASQTELTRLADGKQPMYSGADDKDKARLQLKGLNDFFASKPAHNDDQYAALRDLKRAVARQDASLERHSVLANARFESSYTNLSRLDEQSVASKILSVVNPHHAPSNAENVAKLLDQDPTLKSILKDLQNSKGTLARVRLEPKDSVIDRIDQGSRDGSLTQKELSKLLEDRDNMRIKAITVFKSAAQTDGFTTPLPILSGTSSTSVGVTKVVGKINFNYGEDQDKPKNYFVDGDLARPSKTQSDLAQALKKEGLELKS